MDNKKRYVLLIVTFLLFVAISTPASATSISLDADGNLEKMNSELLITGLVNGDIQPVNEFVGDFQFNIINTVNETQAMKMHNEEPSVAVKDQIIDIRKVSNTEEAPMAESYVATVIYTNEYYFPDNSGIMPLLDKTLEESFCDVTMACVVSYDAIYPHSDDKDIRSCKIKSVTGTYVSKTDPQMRCTEISLHSSAFGCSHASASDARQTRSFVSEPETFTSPVMGKDYKHITNQEHYFCTSIKNTFNRGVMNFTVARYNSGYTGSSEFVVNL